jgi:hypothetical protein
MDLESLKSNHTLHAVGIGLLTTVLLKNNKNNIVIGGLTGLGLYVYMSLYSHSLPNLFGSSTDLNNTEIENNSQNM